MDVLLNDIRIGLRGFRRAPGFAVTATLTLALGIGLSTAVFTVANATLLRRLPVRDQDRIVTLWGDTGDERFRDWPLDLRDAREFARTTHVLSQTAFFDYYGPIEKPVREGDAISRLRRSRVSGGFFDVLGAFAIRGRTLRPSDDNYGAAPVAVLSYAAWQRRFGGDEGILGHRLVQVDDAITYTIVGVMPQGLDFPRGTDFWATELASMPPKYESLIALNVIGRLGVGATPEMARGEMTAFYSRPEAPARQHKMRGVVNEFPRLVLGDTKPAVVAFAVAAALLLLITSINVAILLLVRGLSRVREVAVRSALGGSRNRIVVQLLVENALLAAVGGVLGVLVATIAIQSFVAFAPAGTPRLDEIRVDRAALLGAMAITAVAMLVFSVAPAFVTSRVDLHEMLRSDGRQTARRGSRFVAEGLVTGQVALALLVLAGAGLIARSLIKLEHADLSFEPSHLLIGELALPAAQFDDEAKQHELLERLLPRLTAIPGVVAASPIVAVPFSGSHGWDGTVAIEGQSDIDIAGNPRLNMEAVGPEYFKAFGIPVIEGRGFTDADREGLTTAVVVSQSTARQFWPEKSAIGKTLLFGPKWSIHLSVVGVVPDTRYRNLRDARASIYFPFRQSFLPTPTALGIRTVAAPETIVPAVRRALAEVAPDVVLASAAPFESYLAGPLAQPRLNALLLTLFAGAAAVLVAVGLFGVMATMVRQRTREFGVRMALGAEGADLLRMVVRRALLITATGLVIGLLGAIGTNRLLGAMLYEVSPTDGVTLIMVGALMLGVAVVAGAMPARAATRISPLVALRSED